MTPDLSVLIPARNERWLSRTVADVCAHAKGNTEVLVVLDGAWPEPGFELVQHPRVHIVHLPIAIGQRAATNLAARLSSARYVMKLDAHCAVADGFDVELIRAAKELGPDVTQIPAQFNLHIFDWVCGGCRRRIYQGPTPDACSCGSTFSREIVWNAKRRKTEFWRFDSDLKFTYWGSYKHRPEAQGEIVDVMTSLGACFFMERDRFWQLGGLDTGHGGWGQLGVEVALKSALSGGRHVVNRRTWFSHLFRTQGGDFSFPYQITGSEQERAREYSRHLWLGNRWPKQVRPLAWWIDKFAPIPGWHDGGNPTPALVRVREAADLFAVSLPHAVPMTGDAVLSASRTGSREDVASSAMSAHGTFDLVPGALLSRDLIETDPTQTEGRGVREVSHGTEQMALGAVGLRSIDRRYSLGSSEVFDLQDQPHVGRVAARLGVADDVIKHRNVSPEAHGNRLDQPGVHQTMELDGIVEDPQANLSIPVLVSAPIPDPAIVRTCDCDVSKEARERARVEMRDGEILGSSHDAASYAVLGSGPARCDQHRVGPSILPKTLSKSIVYYSHGRAPDAILTAARRTIEQSGLSIVAVTLQPIRWPSARNIVLSLEPGVLTMFRQILAGLEALDTDVVFFAEHDCAYHRSHWTFTPPNDSTYYYNLNVVKVDAATGRAVRYLTKQTSALCADRELLLAHYRKRIAVVEAQGFSRRQGFEPGSHGRAERIDDVPSDVWQSRFPNIDIRHSQNLTASRWSPDDFRDPRSCEGWREYEDDIPGWGVTRGRFNEFLQEVHGVQQAVA